MPWPGVQEALAACGELSGKILLDATNPLNYGADGLSLALGFTTSGGERVAALAPGARVVKAFNSVTADNMGRAFQFEPRLAMFVASDDLEAKHVVMTLAGEIGFQPFDAGPLENARLLEPFAMLLADQAYVRGRGTACGFALTGLSAG